MQTAKLPAQATTGHGGEINHSQLSEEMPIYLKSQNNENNASLVLRNEQVMIKSTSSKHKMSQHSSKVQMNSADLDDFVENQHAETTER